MLEFINLIHLFCEYGQLKMVEHVFKGCLASCRARLFKKSFTEAWYQYSSWCQGGPRSSDQVLRFVTATTLLMIFVWLEQLIEDLTECQSLILAYSRYNIKVFLDTYELFIENSTPRWHHFQFHRSNFFEIHVFFECLFVLWICL